MNRIQRREAECEGAAEDHGLSQPRSSEQQDCAENGELEELANELFALKGAGEDMVRALDVLERHLPEDFWLETMTLAFGSDEELGVEREDERPILRVKGRARQGTDSPTLLWEEFVGSLRADLAEAAIKDRMGQNDFALDLTSLARREPPGLDAAGVEGEGQ